MMTDMFSNTQLFRDDLATTGAFFSGVAWINEHDCPTSFFRFVGAELHELVPGNINNALVDGFVPVLLHVSNVKVFQADDLIGVNDLAGLLMRKISTAIGNALVYVVQGTDSLTTFTTAFRQSRHLALGQASSG